MKERDYDAPVHPFPGIRVIGGPEAQRTAKADARTCVFGGNLGRYDLLDNAWLLVRDTWYESNAYPPFFCLRGSGTLTLDNHKIAMTLPLDVPGLEFKGFKGRVALHGITFDVNAEPQREKIRIDGDGAGLDFLFMGAANRTPYLPDVSKAMKARLAFINNQLQPNLLDDLNGGDADFVRAMLAATRTARPQPVSDRPRGATDVRFRRVYTDMARTGVHLKAEPAR